MLSLIILLLLLRINNKVIIINSSINSSPITINESLLNNSIILKAINITNKTNPSPDDIKLLNDYLILLSINESINNNPLINSSINASLILKSTPVISDDLLLVAHNYLVSDDPHTMSVISNHPYYFECYIYYSTNKSIRLIATSSDAVINCVNKTVIDSPTTALCINCNQYPHNSYGCNECVNNRINAESIEYVNCFNNNLSVNYFTYDNYYFIIIGDDAGLILNSINMNINDKSSP